MNKSLWAIIIILAVVAIGFFAASKNAEKDLTMDDFVDEEMNNKDMLSGKGEHDVTTSEPTYTDSEGTAGFYAKPIGEGNFPGVVMIHEWWGLNQNIKDMASELASHGYRVLAVDLYNGEVAETPDRARELVSGLDQEAANQNLLDATEFLRSEGSENLASLGWCFGGGQSLNLSLAGADLDATVIYYGQLVTDESELDDINWPVLGIFGEEDTSIPVSEVNAFQTALNDLGIENDINIYPGVGHAFANPSGANYAPEETRDAWQKTLGFLMENLKSD